MLGKHSLARTSTILILPQLGLCFSSGFFDGPSVVVLVACQRRAAREGLLTVGIRAFVGSLARVNAAMPGQRRRVAKGLATSLTHMRLLSGVYTGMYCQSRALDKLLSTPWPLASMGSNSGMNTLMSSKVTAPCETLVTG